MAIKKVKISEKEYKILKSIQKYVNKWVNVDNGGKPIYVKNSKQNYRTDEETFYQDRFIRANDKFVKLKKENKK